MGKVSNPDTIAKSGGRPAILSALGPRLGYPADGYFSRSSASAADE
jgi:hypothetical protein